MPGTLPYSRYTRAEVESRLSLGESFVYYGRIITTKAELDQLDDSVFAYPEGGTTPYPAPAGTGLTADQIGAIATAKAQEVAGPIETAADQAKADAATALAATRAISSPVPTAVYTQDYSALSDDQRTIHVSASPHVLTALNPKDEQNRRFVFDNAGTAAVTIIATCLSPRPDGSRMWTNPVIPPGGSIEVISQFVPGMGSDPAPSDLRLNGSPAPSNTVGAWVWSLVTMNVGSPSATTFSAYQSDVSTALGSKEPTITPGASSSFWSGNKTWQSAPVLSVNSKTGTVSLSASDVGAQPSGNYATLVSGTVPSSQLPAAPVQSVAGKTGVVTLAIADTASLQASLDAKAPLASPNLSGVPTAPTAAPGTNTTQVASTAFVTSAVSSVPSSVTSVNGSAGVVVIPIDPIAGTAGLRTLGTGSQQSAAGNHVHSVATTSADGFESAADKTSLEALKAAGWQVAKLATDANGLITWTFSTPFASGVVPVVIGMAISPSGGTANTYNVQMTAAPTNASASIKVNVASGNTITIILGGVINIFAPAPSGVVVHLAARAP